MTNWFQTNSAYQLFQNSMGEIHPLRFKSEHCACVVAIMGKGWSKRAIIQGGLEINAETSPEELSSLLQDIIAQCQSYGVVYIETRNFSDYTNYKSVFENNGFQYEPHFDVHIQLVNYHLPEAKHRQIQKCQREGQYWEETRNQNDVHQWYQLLKKLYRCKIHRPLPSEQFFHQAAQCADFHLLVVRDSSSHITGGVLLPVHNKTSYEWYICGNTMSTYAAIDWSMQHGLTLLDTMGAGTPNKPYGVRDFKLQMGGELHEFGRFVYVNKPFVYNLGKRIVNLL